MDDLILLCKRIKKISPNFIINEVLKDKNLQKYIISLNQNDQLADQGIDSMDKKLRSYFARAGQVYSNTTINLKSDKSGLASVTDHVTLFDTGEFYRSFKIKLSENEFEITANTLKDNGDLMDTWGSDILGLTPENLQLLIELIKEKIVPIIIKLYLNE